MKRRNQTWTGYLKANIGRTVLWGSLALVAASLLVASIALPLPRRPGGHIEGAVIKELEDREEAPSSNAVTSKVFLGDHFLTFNGTPGYSQGSPGIIFP